MASPSVSLSFKINNEYADRWGQAVLYRDDSLITITQGLDALKITGNTPLANKATWTVTFPGFQFINLR